MALLYCYYGDDFTGSTDVLEQLAMGGVASVLFLTLPTPAQLARFAGSQAIGFAGDARSRSPEWMSNHLTHLFTSMRELAPAVVQYKVCSTFDSAPHRGSIGRGMPSDCEGPSIASWYIGACGSGDSAGGCCVWVAGGNV